MKILFSSATLRAWSNRLQGRNLLRPALGELAANAIAKILRDDDRNRRCANLVGYAQMYRGLYGSIASRARRSCGRQLGSLFVHARELSRNHQVSDREGSLKNCRGD